MFSGPINPYDELVDKATDENLASEDWDVNLQICDKVTEEGAPGARNAVAALVKRLAHRNPNVQIYALELANTLAQNCQRPLQQELAGKQWTMALERILNDRATVKPVRNKVLKYIKEWTQQFEGTGDPQLGLMSELYDKLRSKDYNFDEADDLVPTREDARRQAEEDELARVLELSKQDKGGRGATGYNRPGGSSSGVGSSSAASAAAAAPFAAAPSAGPPMVAASYASGPVQTNAAPHSQYRGPSAHDYELMDPPLGAGPEYQAPQSGSYAQQGYPAPAPAPVPDGPLDINKATRVRALYSFTSETVGELPFERGDMIKVLDRSFHEWWRGACNGKIGIFPATYVEPLPEPTYMELQEEAQEEARVFASLSIVDELLRSLKDIDPARGERLEDNPEIQEMYQRSVGLQGGINALIKKYSDQKAELEHMNANLVRAMQQYEELKGGAPPAQPYAPQPYGVPPSSQDSGLAPQSYGYNQYPQESPAAVPQGPQYQLESQAYPTESPAVMPQAQPGYPQQHGQPPHGIYYQNAHSSTSVNHPPAGHVLGSPPRQGSGSAPADPNQAAWDAYYRQQGQVPPQGAPPPGAPVAAPYPQQQYYAQQTADGVTGQMGQMSVS
ncbi:hypothetical protein CcaverHIS002_0601050 [Cutaneotrichosporon cavernicola]|uniref:Class E vacuolar protein-sorting machinery protein HSE1 n=1 Tax=Cutaneotrichosporon cavernicola TaxID=279322 RepID=A0AA48L5T0_9TREE|nr:uncharacterized protein CcaverHIS019_0501150 [Cutaneotrichosporon cavernicola]BEI85818.1 hypothetical protein CcaverHIS002_0601050 [Cutaneotrichosporon cavernicola]BEI92487.1 hypothetical protein CcaverHIS019_0501150 [Cutaneotrichosporon cavernicola]BEJ00259.1 hypothetical protein CcaverHIS631_0501160 [Cutaneotrichosporon cavernicola]BEJ08029.1 hypothetical protein CcaverHIS641_0501140 [Cutaneotrichosporon cavernicola]